MSAREEMICLVAVMAGELVLSGKGSKNVEDIREGFQYTFSVGG